MVGNIFHISDTHFSHNNIITFKNKDGSLLRPFLSIDEMDELMVQNWNNTINHGDTVYHHGDVAMNKRALPILGRLNGRKILIKGNHDIFKLKDYIPYFEDIRAYKIMPKHGIICSHIPIHTNSLDRWILNLHGHLHADKLNDKRYRCISVEQINYTPIALDEIIADMEK